MNTLRLAIVSCGFLGFAPVASGTFGTLGGVAIALALAGSSRFALWTLLAAILLYLVGRSLGDWAERWAGRKDPGVFVIDEVVGYLITVLWWQGPSLVALIVAFCLFRFFDIVKPWPVRRMEAFGGGDGIMLDDVVAGLYGLLVMIPLRLWVGDPELWTFNASTWPFGG